MNADSVVWLYAVTGALPPRALAGIMGVDGEPVRPIGHEQTVAVAGTVPSAEFGQPALTGNLEDLDWLAATARAHDAVVRAVARAGATVPLRLATICRDDRGVWEMLRDRAAELDAVLSTLSGRAEWGAKVYLAERPVVASVPRAESGTAYLHRRRAQLSAQRERAWTADQQADEMHRELAALAVATCRHPAQDPRLSARSAAMLLNGAYLVDDLRAAEFTATAGELNARYTGIELELTGPWPAYSFTGAAR